jgi:C_GCAxxG_C_C family probable redox protein
LQILINNEGINTVVESVCGLTEESPIHKKVVTAYKTLETRIEWIAKSKKAYQLGFEYEKKYHGCGQSVIAAATEALGIFDDKVFESATGLCGGIGLVNSSNCSAFTGGAMVIGMVYARHRQNFGGDRESKYTNFRLVQDLREKFVEKYGTIMCSEVHRKLYGRAFDLRQKPEQEAFEAAGGHGDHGCTEVVADVAKWTVEIIAKEYLENNFLD